MAFPQFIQLMYSIQLGISMTLFGVERSQSVIEISSEDPVYTFGESIEFSATISTEDQIAEVLLLMQVAGGSDVQVHPVMVGEDGYTSLEIDLTEYPLDAFSKYEYWFQVNSTNGETFTSSRKDFFYLDNRFQWNILDSKPIKIHWYSGELDFANEVLDIAWAAFESTQNLLPVFLPETMDIYVYEDLSAMQEALPDNAKNWIAGHADPSQGVVLLSLPPGPDQKLEMERQIPHELMHIAMYYTDANVYTHLPAWLNEGFASLAELNPDPEHQVMLERAFDTDQLLPLSSLCTIFPIDSQEASLAYAESASFTAYLRDRFGDPGLNKLMAAYASRLDCERGVESALGTDLAELENNWIRTNFAGNALMITIQEYLPWMILLFVILTGPIIIGIVIFLKRPTRIEL